MSGEGEETRVDELERLRKWKVEALEVMRGLEEVGHALGVELGERITGRVAVDRALDLRNERDRAVTTIAAVRTLLDEADSRPRMVIFGGETVSHIVEVDTLRRLLDGADTGHGSTHG